MGNPKHVKIVKRGTDAIIAWRGKNPGVPLDVSNAYLSRANLSRANLSGADFSRANLSEANLSGADFSRANLSEANLIGADFSEANLSEANLSEANLAVANLSEANLIGAHLSRADLSEARLGGADLSKAYLSGAHLSRAYLIAADLSEANLSEARLGGAILSGANLSGANLSRADLTSADVMEAELSEANLSEARLGGAKLIGADFIGANLSEADFSGADLNWANFSRADLSGAKLSRANLSGANLSRADLSGANLSGANLSEANLSRVDLSGAELKEAAMGWTLIANLDLSVANGLETVRHGGPSSVGVDTLSQSKGEIPKEFLRGCGLSDWEIAAAKLYRPGIDVDGALKQIGLLCRGPRVPFCSCFISYSHKDEEFAKRLISRMRDEGLRVWYPPEEMKGGRKIHEQIDEAIRFHDKLLLVLSEHSMASEWVATEIYLARQREVNEGKRVLFPIRLVPFDDIRQWKCPDADTGKDMGREIREYFIPDFSNWQDYDAFEAGFKRLLDDLKAEADRDAGDAK